MKLLPFLLASLFGLVVVNASSSASTSVPTSLKQVSAQSPADTVELQSIDRRGFWERRTKQSLNGGAQQGSEAVGKPKSSLGEKLQAVVKRIFKPIFLPSVDEIHGKARGAVETFLEQTLYSKENQPESNRHAEWNGFLSAWLLVAIPVPLPILAAALSLNVAILLASSWDDAIKNKFLIGLSHGTMVFLVLLRTLEDIVEPEAFLVSPRVAAIGLNLGTNLFFGHAGSYRITKYLMDSAIWAAMFYILFEYLR